MGPYPMQKRKQLHAPTVLTKDTRSYDFFFRDIYLSVALENL